MAFRNIVVGTDFSEAAHRGLEQALDLAKAVGAKLHLVHAYRVPVQVEAMYGISLPGEFGLTIRDAAARKLEKARAEVGDAGVEVECHLVDAGPADALASAADKVDADLVVVGTRGLTGLKHVLLGSVAQRVTHIAPCSVLVVRDDD